jgi:hypothetical protein
MKTTFTKTIATSLQLGVFLSTVMSVAQPATAQTFFGGGSTSNSALNTTNVGMGFQCLNANTSGVSNSAFGYRSLFMNTTGANNCSFGMYSLFANTTGQHNTGVGISTLSSNTNGSFNTAIGSNAMLAGSGGQCNSAVGYSSLLMNGQGSYNVAMGNKTMMMTTTGNYNSGIGAFALQNNGGGGWNTANGAYSLFNNNAGNFNTAIGYGALINNQMGSNNVALGYNSGSQLIGTNNIAIGHIGTNADNGVIRIGTPNTHTRAFVSGINGVTITGGVGVYVNANGQLGTVTSSRRFKYDIKNMANVSERLLQLRPVTFRYKEADGNGQHPVQYGFIAEEVAKVFPDLVQYDKKGKPFTVFYHLIAPLLLNEFQKEHKRVTQIQAAHKAEVASLKQKSDAQSAEIARLKNLLQQQNQTVAALKQAQAEQGKMLSQITVALQHRSSTSRNVSLPRVQH